MKHREIGQQDSDVHGRSKLDGILAIFTKHVESSCTLDDLTNKWLISAGNCHFSWNILSLVFEWRCTSVSTNTYHFIQKREKFLDKSSTLKMGFPRSPAQFLGDCARSKPLVSPQKFLDRRTMFTCLKPKAWVDWTPNSMRAFCWSIGRIEGQFDPVSLKYGSTVGQLSVKHPYTGCPSLKTRSTSTSGPSWKHVVIRVRKRPCKKMGHCHMFELRNLSKFKQLSFKFSTICFLLCVVCMPWKSISGAFKNSCAYLYYERWKVVISRSSKCLFRHAQTLLKELLIVTLTYLCDLPTVRANPLVIWNP